MKEVESIIACDENYEITSFYMTHYKLVYDDSNIITKFWPAFQNKHTRFYYELIRDLRK